MREPEAKDIPFKYDHFLGPMLFRPYAGAALPYLPSASGALLEIAAGTGIAAQALSQTWSVTATDKSRSMLGLAAIKNFPGVRLAQAKAEDLPFLSNSFDAAVCQFGFMFFRNLIEALREVHRVLRPSGTLVALTWDRLDRNPVGAITHDVLGRYLAHDAAESLEVPYSLHDADALSTTLRSAGFVDPDVKPISHRGDPISAKDAAQGLLEGNPVFNTILRVCPLLLPELSRTLAREIADAFGDPFAALSSALLIRAVKPDRSFHSPR